MNKIIFRAIDEIDLPFTEKIKFLQMHRLDSRAEYLMKVLS